MFVQVVADVLYDSIVLVFVRVEVTTKALMEELLLEYVAIVEL